jgi:hypothetical protein
MVVCVVHEDGGASYARQTLVYKLCISVFTWGHYIHVSLNS